MSGLGLTFLRRGGLTHPTAGSDYIKFADDAVFNMLMSKGVSSDGVGITKDDALNVYTISTWFSGNTTIVSFDELKWFANVTKIDNNAFKGCTNLQTIDCENIIEVGNNAFEGCTAITGSFVLRNCTKIGADAFKNIGAEELDLRSVTSLPTAGTASTIFGNRTILKRLILTSATAIPANALYNYSALEYVELGDALTSIGQNAFNSCKSLKFTLNAPNLVTIGAYAFEKSSLPAISSLGKVTQILDLTFSQCTSLKEVNFPTTLVSIGRLGFQNCDLQSVDLGENIASMSNSVFENSKNMRYAIVRAATPPTIVNIYVWGNTNNCPIYVPDASVDAYKAANLWSNAAIINRIKPLSEFNG